MQTKTIVMILLVTIATIGAICLATVTTVKTTLADSSRTVPPAQPPGRIPLGNNGQCQKAGILEAGCDNQGFNGPGHK